MLTSYLFTFYEYQYNIDNFISMFIMAGIKKKKWMSKRIEFDIKLQEGLNDKKD